MKFNKEILKAQGIADMKNAELVKILKDKVYYLRTHNKNYTKQQYYEIQDIEEILSALEG